MILARLRDILGRSGWSATGADRISSNTPCWWRCWALCRGRSGSRDSNRDQHSVFSVEYRHPGPLAAPKSWRGLLRFLCPWLFRSRPSLRSSSRSLAAVIDVRTRRIPNILTFGAALCACLLHVSTRRALRASALSVAGWLIGVAIFFPFFALGGMGGGDVKLVGAIGACLGPMGALHVALGAAVAGGAVAVLVTLRSGYFGTCVANVGRLIDFWRAHGLTPMPDLTLSSGSGPRLAYAVPILIGTVGALWFG